MMNLLLFHQEQDDQRLAAVYATARLANGLSYSDFKPDSTQKTYEEMVSEELRKIQAERYQKRLEDEAEIEAQRTEESLMAARQRGIDKAKASVVPTKEVSQDMPVRKRKHHLHSVILEAQSKAVDHSEPGAVWAQMVIMARACILGLNGVTQDGIKYFDAKDNSKEFSKKQLFAYLKGSNVNKNNKPKSV